MKDECVQGWVILVHVFQSRRPCLEAFKIHWDIEGCKYYMFEGIGLALTLKERFKYYAQTKSTFLG